MWTGLILSLLAFNTGIGLGQLEASAKDAKVADVLRRWHIDSSQLPHIRTKVKEGALTQLKKGPGRNPKDLVSGARNGAHSCRQP